MREHSRDRLLSPLEELYAARRVSNQEFSDIWNKLPSAPVLKHETQVPNDPVQGMFVVDPVLQEFCFYLGTEWICIGKKQPTFACKVYADRKANKIGNGAYRFCIPARLNGFYIVEVEAFNGVAGIGATQVQISKAQGTIDLLSTKITIDSGQLWSGTAINQPVINQAVNQVFSGNDIWIDVDAIGSGSQGLGVYIICERTQI